MTFRQFSTDRPNLSKVRQPELVTAALVDGRVRSLDGLTKMSSLKVLTLENGLPSWDLSALLQLSCLEDLTLLNVPSAESWNRLSQLQGLKRLALLVSSPGDADALVALDLSALASLRKLWLLNEQAVPRELNVLKLPQTKELGTLWLQGFTLSTAGLAFIESAEKLTSLRFTPSGPRQISELRRIVSGRAIDLEVIDGTAWQPTFGVIQRLPGSDYTFVALDVASAIAVGSNEEATNVLSNYLLGHDAGLLARLEFDAEAGAVWAYARDEEDLEQLRELVNALSAQGARRS